MAGRELAERDVLPIQAESRLSRAVVRTVALEAAVREDRLDVKIEIDQLGHAGDVRGAAAAGRCRHERGNGYANDELPGTGER